MSKNQVHVSVRVPEALADALERIAAAEDRTVSAEVRRIIRNHVAAHAAPMNAGQEGDPVPA